MPPEYEHIYPEIGDLGDFHVREEVFRELRRRIEESSADVRSALNDFAPEADEYQSRVIGCASPTIRLLAPLTGRLARVATGVGPRVPRKQR